MQVRARRLAADEGLAELGGGCWEVGSSAAMAMAAELRTSGPSSASPRARDASTPARSSPLARAPHETERARRRLAHRRRGVAVIRCCSAASAGCAAAGWLPAPMSPSVCAAISRRSGRGLASAATSAGTTAAPCADSARDAG